MITSTDVVDAGAIVIVKAVVDPFPLNVSVRKDDVIGLLPMYAMFYPAISMTVIVELPPITASTTLRLTATVAPPPLVNT